MSYILDALRKSEQERRQVDPLVLAPMAGEAMALPRHRLGVLPIAAGLAIATVAAAAYWMLMNDRVPEALQPGAPAALTAPAATPRESRTARVALPKETELPPAPKLTPNPFVAATREPAAVRDLAKEAHAKAPVPAEPVAVAKARLPAAAAAEPARAPSTEPVKFLRAMSPEFQRALPELVVNIHIYAPSEADRILYINNRQYHAGGRVSDDVVVEEIVEDGAVMSFRGQRFKLPRPS